MARLASLADHIHYPKGHLLFEAGKSYKHIYAIGGGIVRAFCYNKEEEITLEFCKEGDIVLNYRGYIHQKEGYECVELLEPCDLYRFRTTALQELYSQDVAVANWGRRLAEQELLKAEERLIFRQIKTATERYEELLNNNPEVIQRVPLSCIASYLGITQVSLSRIRSPKR